MTPRRLLNSREVGEKLGLSSRAVTQRHRRRSANLAEADFVIHVDGIGDILGWLPGRKDLQPQHPAPDDPALIPGDPWALDDDFLIGPRQWAELAGVSEDRVIARRSEAARRRAQGTPQPGDMPAEDEKRGNSPRWRMATFRATPDGQEARRLALAAPHAERDRAIIAQWQTGGHSMREIGEQYGISYQHVGRIVRAAQARGQDISEKEGR